jgi:hypothetical protein
MMSVPKHIRLNLVLAGKRGFSLAGTRSALT